MSLPLGVLAGVVLTVLFYAMWGSDSSASLAVVGSRYVTASPQTVIASLLHFTYNIGEHELKVFSQNGEDGILHYVFSNIGHGDRYYVEFGSSNASECNTRLLYENNGWDGILMDGNGISPDKRVVHNHMITPKNIVELFQQYSVPKKFSLLSVDIDSYDYWVLKAILEAGYRPRVLLMEINRNFEMDEAYTVNQSTYWDLHSLFGFSPKAARDICDKHGYHMVHLDRNVINAVCINRATLSEVIQERTGYVVHPEELKKWLPPWGYVYKRSYAIHVDSYATFREAFKKHHAEGWWLKLNEAGEVIR
ncbi:hypothetical protein SeMB42_g01177 [Synchytrium endobioticum]|nr:hypothetical protein SeMB42_g01177 [Synchytrium endobioticum]